MEKHPAMISRKARAVALRRRGPSASPKSRAVYPWNFGRPVAKRNWTSSCAMAVAASEVYAEAQKLGGQAAFIDAERSLAAGGGDMG